MPTDKGYKKLLVWTKADELAKAVYAATKHFPKEEIYGITSQLRRAALSIPVNICEGMGRQGRGETAHFLNIALGSNSEVEYLLGFCRDIGYLDEKYYNLLEQQREHVGRLLYGIYRSWAEREAL